MRDQFRVRVGLDRPTVGFELTPQLTIVFDDAVVHDHDRARALGMCVALGRLAMRGPTGVTNANAAFDRCGADFAFEVVELAFGTADIDHVAVKDRDACRVVAAVLEPTQPVDQDVRCISFAPDIANDSTHTIYS